MVAREINGRALVKDGRGGAGEDFNDVVRGRGETMVRERNARKELLCRGRI